MHGVGDIKGGTSGDTWVGDIKGGTSGDTWGG